MAGKNLDALAKGLADEHISRGQALRRMVAVLLGGALAATPAAAFAQSTNVYCYRIANTGTEPDDFRCFSTKKQCETARRDDPNAQSRCIPSTPAPA
jgi:hypothetical protein